MLAYSGELSQGSKAVVGIIILVIIGLCFAMAAFWKG